MQSRETEQAVVVGEAGLDENRECEEWLGR